MKSQIEDAKNEEEKKRLEEEEEKKEKKILEQFNRDKGEK